VHSFSVENKPTVKTFVVAEVFVPQDDEFIPSQQE